MGSSDFQRVSCERTCCRLATKKASPSVAPPFRMPWSVEDHVGNAERRLARAAAVWVLCINGPTRGGVRTAEVVCERALNRVTSSNVSPPRIPIPRRSGRILRGAHAPPPRKQVLNMVGHDVRGRGRGRPAQGPRYCGGPITIPPSPPQRKTRPIAGPWPPGEPAPRASRVHACGHALSEGAAGWRAGARPFSPPSATAEETQPTCKARADPRTHTRA